MEMHLDRSLSLSPLTVLPCSPLEQVDAALDAGFQAIGLRLLPVLATDVDVMSDGGLQRALERHIAASGLEVLDIEVVRVDPQLDVEAIAPALEFAGGLGARWLAATSATRADYRAEDEPEVVRRLAELCEAAARRGLGVMLEFMPSRGIGTLEHAVRIVTAVGHPDLTLTIDALHFYRSGATAHALHGIDPQRLGCVQLCDGPATPPTDLAQEARYERLYPGEGDFPLGDLMAALPSDLPVSVEAPSRSRAHLSVTERSRESASCARRLLASVA